MPELAQGRFELVKFYPGLLLIASPHPALQLDQQIVHLSLLQPQRLPVPVKSKTKYPFKDGPFAVPLLQFFKEISSSLFSVSRGNTSWIPVITAVATRFS